MLSLYDNRPCGRREFLRIGGLGLGGLSLADLLSAKASAAAGNPVRDKSVIFLFMHGGPSQTETFDPKMTAPSGVRSATGEVKTSLPGVTFGGTFEKLAPFADRMAIVRSYVTGDGRHDIKPIVSQASADANLGSLFPHRRPEPAGQRDAHEHRPLPASRRSAGDARGQTVREF